MTCCDHDFENALRAMLRAHAFDNVVSRLQHTLSLGPRNCSDEHLHCSVMTDKRDKVRVARDALRRALVNINAPRTRFHELWAAKVAWDNEHVDDEDEDTDEVARQLATLKRELRDATSAYARAISRLAPLLNSVSASSMKWLPH